jgi:hypothetical protein
VAALKVLAIVLTALGALTLASAVALFKGTAARTVETRGVVVSHEPAVAEHTVGGRSARRTRTEVTRIRIEYEAAGATRSLEVTRADELAARDFPVEAAVPVYFAEAAPDDATLVPDDAVLFPIVLLACGSLLLLCGGGMYLFARAHPA